MRKFFNPLPDGGAPIYNQELNGVLQSEFWDVIEQSMEAIIYGSSPNVIVTGGALVNNGDGTLNISSGMAYINNGVDTVNNYMRFPSFNNVTFPAYLTTNTVVVEQEEFADTVDRDYISQYTAQVVSSVPATPYITLDFPTDNQIYLRNILAKQESVSQIIDSRNAERRARPELVATVDAAGNMTETFSIEGTWSCVPTATGLYSIRQDGTPISNPTVIATPIEISTSNGVSISWKPSNGNIKVYDSNGGAALNNGFTIIVYPL